MNYLFIGGGNQGATIAIMVVLGIFVIGAFFVLPTLTNRKRRAAIHDLRNSVGKGDVIKTVSGVIGTVVDMEDISPVDKVMIIETGCEGCKTYMRIDFAGMLMIMSKAGQPNPYIECCNGSKTDVFEIEPVVDVVEPVQAEMETSEVSTPVATTEVVDEFEDTMAETPTKPKSTPIRKTTTTTRKSTTAKTTTGTRSTTAKKTTTTKKPPTKSPY
ncbi:MAG: preprotein translocase subunit YajC [Firmicutes bacterium]|nr:preprotein translocase subunit YajC [Bacillota bacterium]